MAPQPLFIVAVQPGVCRAVGLPDLVLTGTRMGSTGGQPPMPVCDTLRFFIGNRADTPFGNSNVLRANSLRLLH